MAKTDFLTADMTRRQFMKISGKSLAGLTLSASMLSLFEMCIRDRAKAIL